MIKKNVPSLILFVCAGNICRSPAAEGVMLDLVNSAGHSASIGIDSAGTHGYHTGELADPRMREAASRRSLAKFPNRQVSTSPIAWALFDQR